MKFVAICASGLEEITQLEIKEILKVSSKVLIPGRVMFEVEDLKDFLKKVQSVIKVYELKQRCDKVEDVKVFEVEPPFRVVCSRKGENNFSSQDVERKVGEKFFENGVKVDLKDPKTVVFVDIVDKEMFVGVDLTPRLLSKREYRIKTHNQSLNSCIAYALVRLSGYDGDKILLDPFAKDGVVAIEALTFKKGKVFAFDSLFPNVRNVEINAKLAGVRKDVNVSRTEVEWLDTKFKEGEVDCIVSSLPFPSRIVPEKVVRKVYEELLHQVDFILKKKGKAVFIAPKLDLLKKLNKNLKVVDEKVVGTSALKYDVVLFSK